jgi:NTP pyrophosphatase (non-canonical NTP hydrolase)
MPIYEINTGDEKKDDALLRKASSFGLQTVNIKKFCESEFERFSAFLKKFSKPHDPIVCTRLFGSWRKQLRDLEMMTVNCRDCNRLPVMNLGNELTSAVNDYHERNRYTGEIDVIRMIKRAREELSELEESIDLGESMEQQLMELADVFHFLFCIVKGYGINNMSEARKIFGRKNVINQMRLHFGKKDFTDDEMTDVINKYW